VTLLHSNTAAERKDFFYTFTTMRKARSFDRVRDLKYKLIFAAIIVALITLLQLIF
jgi:hypothetical protein